MDKVAHYRDKASEIYKANRKIIFILAFLDTVLVSLFDILKADGFISNLLVIIVKLAVTAPLPMCTYHVYTRAILGKQTGADFIFSWLTNGKLIVHGIKVQLSLAIRLIGWIIIYFIIAIASTLFGVLGSLVGTIGGLILIYYKELQYEGALYECAADPNYPVSAAFDDGIEKMKYCFKDYVSLWLGMCLPFMVIFSLLTSIFETSAIGITVNALGNAILNFFILPRFHITGILLYNNGNFSHVRGVDGEENLNEE
ncbi:MAG: hypothetical protein IJO16_04265 [Clostridia bacterium]|nr:hypothetical protein [Clostridia bacterium]